jgi:hypothetical protein
MYNHNIDLVKLSKEEVELFIDERSRSRAK